MRVTYEFIKVEIRVFDDHRFFTIGELEQLIYIKLLGLAKKTKNKIPKKMSILKALLRLNRTEAEIESAVNRLKENFPKFKENKYFYYFLGFVERHKKADPKDERKIAKSKSRVEEMKSIYIHFQEKHKESSGVAYPVVYGKDQKLLYELLDIYNIPTLKTLIDEFFESAQNPNEWWADKLSIGVFKSVIPQLIGKLRKKNV